MKVAIIDYGMGNLRSIYNAFKSVNASPVVIQSPELLSSADAIVLPGVGAFGQGMKHLISNRWKEHLEMYVLIHKKPFLGICLGMQLIASYSMEHGWHKGLNWIPGSVELLTKRTKDIRLPHIGWNDVGVKSESKLYKGFDNAGCFYFT
jgi:imidazole glycerol-phosphate synthase subunit HisH